MIVVFTCRQEGVEKGIYKELKVQVKSEDGTVLACFCIYKPVDQNVVGEVGEAIPSPQYRDVMVAGAEEHGLSEYYVNYLRNLKDNGHIGKIDLAGDNF